LKKLLLDFDNGGDGDSRYLRARNKTPAASAGELSLKAVFARGRFIVHIIAVDLSWVLADGCKNTCAQSLGIQQYTFCLHLATGVSFADLYG